MSAEKIADIFTPIIKLIIRLLVLGVVKVIVNNLPGITTIIPTSSISIATIADLVIALVIVSIVVKFGREIKPLLNKNLPGFPELSIIVSYAVILVAVIIGYGSFGSLVLPLLGNNQWVYHIAFLAIALIPSVKIIETLFRSVGKWTDHMVKKVIKETREPTPSTS